MSVLLLILLGAAGEHTGLEKRLETDTRAGRQLSLFRQGQRWYVLLPGLQEPDLRTLMEAFAELVARQPTFSGVFGFVQAETKPRASDPESLESKQSSQPRRTGDPSRRAQREPHEASSELR